MARLATAHTYLRYRFWTMQLVNAAGGAIGPVRIAPSPAVLRTCPELIKGLLFVLPTPECRREALVSSPAGSR
jgi:hypothetical protein